MQNNIKSLRSLDKEARLIIEYNAEKDELISNIRETQTLIDTQIIVINDNYDVVEEAVVLKLGANNFIAKPLKPITLRNYFYNATIAVTENKIDEAYSGFFKFLT